LKADGLVASSTLNVVLAKILKLISSPLYLDSSTLTLPLLSIETASLKSPAAIAAVPSEL